MRKEVGYFGYVVTCDGAKPNPDQNLKYADFTKPFNLTNDASKFALGIVLSQGPIGKDFFIAYVARTINDSEQSYSIIEKEL